MLDLAIMLTFLFVLAIVYGALELSDVFKNRAVIGIISLVLAFFAISSVQIVELISQAFPYLALLFIGVFLLKFIFSLFKGGGERDYTLMALTLALVLIFLANQHSEIVRWLGSGANADNFTGLVALLAIIFIFYGVYRSWSGGK